MRFRPVVLAFAAALACAPVSAQMVPGLRPPTDLADAMGEAFWMGCFYAAAGRPATGLNMDFELAGPNLHPVTTMPEDLRPFAATLPAGARLALVDAPGGQILMAHDPETLRCVLVPTPVDAPGMEAVFKAILDKGWKKAPAPDGAPADTKAFVQQFDPRTALRISYWAASGPNRPQMIVTERVQLKRK